MLVERPVSALRAMLGGWIGVPTIDGPRRVKLPPGSQDGALLKMVGHGVGRRDGSRGDRLVTVRVEQPSELDQHTVEGLKRS